MVFHAKSSIRIEIIASYVIIHGVPNLSKQTKQVGTPSFGSDVSPILRQNCLQNRPKLVKNWSNIGLKLSKNRVWGRIGSIWRPRDDQGGSQDDFCSQNGGLRAPKESKMELRELKGT